MFGVVLLFSGGLGVQDFGGGGGVRNLVLL